MERARAAAVAGSLLLALTAGARPLGAAEAAAPSPPTNVRASDRPSDEGKHIVVEWDLSADDGGGAKSVAGYEIVRAGSASGPFEPTGVEVAAGVGRAVDEVPSNGTDYWYRVRAVTAGPPQPPEGGESSGGQGAAPGPAVPTGGSVPSPAPTPGAAPRAVVSSDSAAAGPVRASSQLFKRELTSVAILTAAFCAAAFYALRRARRGEHIWIRPIGGIDAIDEAIGRATEMGKPILFVPGLYEASDPPTLAAYSILARVAKKVADYQCRLIVPCYYAMVMVVAREVVKNAYTAAGRPDAYVEKDVFYLTQEQFAYVAGINGIMLREKPATNFYLGAFFAESLMLAETGFQAGSIQIAGTDQPVQIPFFVAACDYTLIGEELYAAAAYLSDDPRQKATLKAQDYGKAAILAVIAAGVFLWIVGPALVAIAPSWLPVTAERLAAFFAVGTP